MKACASTVAVAIASVVLWASIADAATRMLGVNPADGVAMFVKKFTLGVGTTVLGAQFESNDPQTVFPKVQLIRDGAGRLSDGVIVAERTSVSGAEQGVVSFNWTAPVVIAETGDYYLAIGIPAGPGKERLGVGPGIGAEPTSSPGASFLSEGVEGTLMSLGLDLSVVLTTEGAGKAAAPDESGQGPEHRNYLQGGAPNPFNPTTTVEFGVAAAGMVRLQIFDIAGRRIQTLEAGVLAPGVYRRVWDGKTDQGVSVAGGIYLARLVVGEYRLQKKLVLLK